MSIKNLPDIQKQKSLAEALKQVKSNYGAGSIMFLSDKVVEKVPIISTGSLNLDKAIGIGGVPQGRITEIFGQTGSGKTTLALNIVREAQKQGGICLFVDAEHALNYQYAAQIGVKIPDLILSQPDSGEQALDIVELMVRSNAVSLVIVDSVAALVAQAELEGEMGDVSVGAQARLLSKALRKLTALLSKSNTAVVFINQIRNKIGGYGNPETTPGGLALPFYSSLRMSVHRTGSIKKGDEVIGQNTKVSVCKNKFAPPYKSIEFELLYGEGINKYKEIIDLALAEGILTRAGSWYSLDNQTIAQGSDALVKLMKEDSTLVDKLNKLSTEANSSPAVAQNIPTISQKEEK